MRNCIGMRILRTKIFWKRFYAPSTIIQRCAHQAHESLNFNTNSPTDDNFNTLVKSYRDKIIYNDFVDAAKLKFGYTRNIIEHKKLKQHVERDRAKLNAVSNLPISLKYVTDLHKGQEDSHNEEVIAASEQYNLPYSSAHNLTSKLEDETVLANSNEENVANEVKDEIKARFDTKINDNWLTDYDKYNDEDIGEISSNYYGTEDPYSVISHVPCGGCGAFLHCKDASLPGYIPSEIYKNYNPSNVMDLKALICQRCHFLNKYNLALQLRVSASDYPKVLRTIQHYDKALVVLIVDLLDFPCSIWPGIADLVGTKRPILVVGNKVDLLPVDGKGFLQRVRRSLLANVKLSGFGMANVKDVCLISAKTGFGIEDLITRLHSIWKYNGDVFLVGCTNVGKSSLFNVLLQSDYCKSQASDLIQRATTSPWPGTTLNLLKFPILRPSGYRLYVRHQRMMSANKLFKEERKLRESTLKKTNDPKYASLMGYVDKTFSVDSSLDENSDLFAVSAQSRRDSNSAPNVGIDENDPLYMLSKWCYDTPGVIQPDQITDLLTGDELLLTFPKQIISPKTFLLRVGQTMFIGGLSRLDFVHGSSKVYFTVFCANTLPVTICETRFADEIYEKFLGTQLFAVPIGKERLSLWPQLKASKDIACKGTESDRSCADVVLSSSGWIAVTCKKDETCTLKGWTPDARGIHVRDSLLPHAVNLRGQKIRKSPAYRKSKFSTI